MIRPAAVAKKIEGYDSAWSDARVEDAIANGWKFSKQNFAGWEDEKFEGSKRPFAPMEMNKTVQAIRRAIMNGDVVVDYPGVFGISSETLDMLVANAKDGQHLEHLLAERPELGRWIGRRVVAGIRPEDLEDVAVAGETAGRTLTATADLVESMGSDIVVHFTVDAPTIRAADSPDLEPLGATTMVARVSARSPVKETGPVELVADTDRLHIFDPETGRTIGPAG